MTSLKRNEMLLNLCTWAALHPPQITGHLPGPIPLLWLSKEVATCYFGKGLKKVEIQFLNIPFCSNFACFLLNFTGNYTPTKVSHLDCPWKYLSSPSDAYYTGQPTQFETKPIKRGWLHSAAFPIKLLVLWNQILKTENELIFNNWSELRTLLVYILFMWQPLLAASHPHAIESDMKECLIFYSLGRSHADSFKIIFLKNRPRVFFKLKQWHVDQTKIKWHKESGYTYLKCKIRVLIFIMQYTL